MLAISYMLGEIIHDMSCEAGARVGPGIDYLATKNLRFAFVSFSPTDPTLTNKMKSAGVVVTVCRTFKESPQEFQPSLKIRHGTFGSECRPCQIEMEVHRDRDILSGYVISRKWREDRVAERAGLRRNCLAQVPY